MKPYFFFLIFILSLFEASSYSLWDMSPSVADKNAEYLWGETVQNESSIFGRDLHNIDKSTILENMMVLSSTMNSSREGSGESREKFSSAGYYLRGLVPGWGQLYSGRRRKGFFFLGGFVLSSASMGYYLYDYNKKRGEYEDFQGSISAMNEKYKESGKAETRANIAITLFSLVYIANLLDILLFPKSDVKKVSSGSANIKIGDRYVSFNMESNIRLLCEGYIDIYVGTRFSL